MIQKFATHGFVVAALIVATFMVSPRSRAITIVSGPAFTQATNAPLAGLLQLTTDVKSRISVVVTNETGSWTNNFYDYSTNHSEILLGFKPGQSNQIWVTAYDQDRNAVTATQALTFVTDPLPADFPTSVVLTNAPSMMEPGYFLFIMYHNNSPISYITIMDNSGNVVWYSPNPADGDSDVRQLDNGDLFVQEASPINDFLEINMLGQTVQKWIAPTNYPVNNHEGILTAKGTILYLSDVSEVVSNFPSSDTDPYAPLITTNVDDNPVVEISTNDSEVLHAWSPLAVLDPTRVTYLTYGGGFPEPYGADNEHANAIIDDTNDNAIIESLRAQNAVFKFSRSTGQLEWILGPHANWGTNWQSYLLTPEGTPFNWNYGQHAPELTPQGTLLLYNDDNYAASPYDPPVADQDNQSSAIEYDINESNMTVSEVWNSAWQTNQDRLYTPYIGRVQWLPKTGNVFVDYGAVSYVNGVHPSAYSTNALMVRLIEYTHDPVPQVVFDLSFFDYGDTSPDYQGYFCYRAYQIPDLYPHPADPVADLVVNNENQIPVLQFSADPTHSYLIQASTDLTNWITIGTPTQEGDTGNYDFEDLDANQYTTRFYRVVTQ
jgi:arylsulfate sulfotransferase